MRLAGLVLAGVIGLAAVAWLGLQDLRSELLAGHEAKIAAVTESGSALLAGAYAREESGELTREEAQAAAFDAIRSIRYEGSEYLFVYQRDGVNRVLGPRPDLEGENLIDLEDPNGVPLIAELSALSADGGTGYLEYMWPDPDDPEGPPLPKLSYVEGFEPWDLFIGTGVYIDDVDAEYAAAARGQVTWVLVVVGLVAAVAGLIVRTIRRPQAALIDRMGDLAEGDNEAEVPGADRRDEIGEMARAVEVFRQNALEKLELEAAAEEEARDRAEAEAAAEAEQRRVLAATADSFESEVGGIVQRVGASSEDLRGAAASLADAAE
ncbi:MAG: cache domain-containing protein, partial [Actinomycetota bacterium]